MRISSRHCVLVLGMHRSGTSAFSRLFNLAGAALPSRMVEASAGNDLGHWEPLDVVRLDDRTLHLLQRSWFDWRRLDWDIGPPGLAEGFQHEFLDIIERQFGDHDLFVVKEPRLCRFAEKIIPALVSRGVEPHVVLPVRHPIEVCGSLEARNQMSYADASLLWLRYNLEAERATRGLPRAIVHYGRLLTDWRTEFERLTQSAAITWRLQPDEFAAEADTFLSPSHRHHRAMNGEIRESVWTTGWVARTYDALDELARDPDSPSGMAALDEVERELSNADPFLEEYYSRMSSRARRAAEPKKPKKQARTVDMWVRNKLSRWPLRLNQR